VTRVWANKSAFLGTLRAAIGFLTRVPMGRVAVADVEAAPPWFPIVGAMLGVVGGVVYAGAGRTMPPAVAASLAIATGLLITGAFHYDGLADVADAFGGGWTKERRLEILNDSRHGTYGVVTLAIVLIIQVSSLASLSRRHGLFVLIAAETLARAGAVVLLAVMQPARTRGLAASSARALNRSSVYVGVGAGVVIAIVAIGWWSIAAIAVVAVCVGLVGLLAQKKIGGMVGDVLGAAEQMAFTGVLVVCVALAYPGR